MHRCRAVRPACVSYCRRCAVFCQGWLAKRSGGNKSTGATVSVGEIRKNWETRWFVLQAEQVSYYKSQQAFLGREKPKATVPLLDMTFQRDQQHRFKLRARAMGRVLALEAPSAPVWPHVVLWLRCQL